MLGRPKTQDGLQKAVPERSVDSERQKSESIKTSRKKKKHKSEGFIKIHRYQHLDLIPVIN